MQAQSAVAEFSGKLPAGISLVGKGDFKQEGGIGYLELGAEAYLRCSHALKPGQGRQYVNAYTIVLDVKLNSLAEWTAVYQVHRGFVALSNSSRVLLRRTPTTTTTPSSM